jgi:hypothetical protein
MYRKRIYRNQWQTLIQKSPTAGAALADVILHGDTDIFDFYHFSLDRFDSQDIQQEEMNM